MNRPLRRHQDDDFSVEILKDLVAMGLTGDKLVRQFEIERTNIKHAVQTMLKEADKIADGSVPGAMFEDVFELES